MLTIGAQLRSRALTVGAEIPARRARKDFKDLDRGQVEIYLVEASDKLLAPFALKLEHAARHTLQRLGIKLVQKAEVKTIKDGAVQLANGRTLTAGTVIWAAGVKASSLAQQLDRPTGHHGGVKVGATLQLPGHPEVFVVGDMAAVEQGGRQLPMLAPVAMQEARLAARNIRALHQGKPLQPFRYWDKGMMATVGRHVAFAQVGRFQLAGFAGWLAWLLIHLVFTIGFRRKLLVPELGMELCVLRPPNPLDPQNERSTEPTTGPPLGRNHEVVVRMSKQPPGGAVAAAPASAQSRELEGKVALITGAGSGIGHAIAESFGRAGAHIVVNYFGYEREAEALAHTLTKSADRSLALKADASNRQQVAQMVQRR